MLLSKSFICSVIVSPVIIKVKVEGAERKRVHLLFTILAITGCQRGFNGKFTRDLQWTKIQLFSFS